MSKKHSTLFHSKLFFIGRKRTLYIDKKYGTVKRKPVAKSFIIIINYYVLYITVCAIIFMIGNATSPQTCE